MASRLKASSCHPLTYRIKSWGNAYCFSYEDIQWISLSHVKPWAYLFSLFLPCQTWGLFKKFIKMFNVVLYMNVVNKDNNVYVEMKKGANYAGRHYK